MMPRFVKATSASRTGLLLPLSLSLSLLLLTMVMVVTPGALAATPVVVQQQGQPAAAPAAAQTQPLPPTPNSGALGAGARLASLLERLSALVQATGASVQKRADDMQVAVRRVLRAVGHSSTAPRVIGGTSSSSGSSGRDSGHPKTTKLTTTTRTTTTTGTTTKPGKSSKKQRHSAPISSARVAAPNLLVATVRAPELSAAAKGDDTVERPSKTSLIMVSKAVLHNGILTVELRNRRDNNSSSSRMTAAPVERRVRVGNRHIDLNGVSAASRATAGAPDLYELQIPVVSREVAGIAAGMEQGGVGDHMSEGVISEDDNSFLVAQLNCTTQFPKGGLKGSLCACAKLYQDDIDRELRCIARMVDRVVVFARSVHNTELATVMFDRAIGCRTANAEIGKLKDTRVTQRLCLMQVLSDAVRKSQDVANRHSRQLLSVSEPSALNKENRQAVDQSGGIRFTTWPRISIRVLAVIAYLVGVTVLVLGVADIAKYYRRHLHSSRRMEEFSQLPDNTRVLYTRLFW